jgi:hypothetical protein
MYPGARQLAWQAVALDASLGLSRVVLTWMNLLLDWDSKAGKEIS